MTLHLLGNTLRCQAVLSLDAAPTRFMRETPGLSYCDCKHWHKQKVAHIAIITSRQPKTIQKAQSKDWTLWLVGDKGLGHVPRPPKNIFENKFSRVYSFPNCHRQFSPSPSARSKLRTLTPTKTKTRLFSGLLFWSTYSLVKRTCTSDTP